MAPQKIPVRVRIDRLARRDDGHLIWTGRLKRGRPYLKGFGNPARVLLEVNHEAIQVRNTCGVERCIEPHHYKVVREKPFKYDGDPRPAWRDPRVHNSGHFNECELEVIDLEVQGLIKGETTEEDVRAVGLKREMLEEVFRRARSA
ncbi:MAG: hypothetical protein E5V65_02335 [Mesorhizobium sp.]|nr:MAG: hypothetical protein E5V65_02335 [Mesorhizobium sp.]